MLKKRSYYSEEFKLKAVNAYKKSNINVKLTSKKLGINYVSLYNWIKKYDKKLTKNKKSYSEKYKRKMVDRVINMKGKCSAYKIAKQEGLSLNNLCSWLYRQYPNWKSSSNVKRALVKLEESPESIKERALIRLEETDWNVDKISKEFNIKIEILYDWLE